MTEMKKKLNDVTRRDWLKLLGATGVTLGGVGTGITVAQNTDDMSDKDGHRRCPKDLNIAFRRKYGKWWPDTYDDIGDEVDPDVFSIEGDRKQVTIKAPFPFAVVFATRKKEHDNKKDDDKHDDKKERDHDRDDHSRHCRFDDCKKQKPVRAEKVDGKFCVTIPDDDHERKRKKKKKKICWFRVFCPKDHKHDDKDHDNGHEYDDNDDY